MSPGTATVKIKSIDVTGWIQLTRLKILRKGCRCEAKKQNHTQSQRHFHAETPYLKIDFIKSAVIITSGKYIATSVTCQTI
jgi:hypothetical protein